MKTVGVKQLKARLWEYLREVRRGEVLLVTDRSEVVAELRPPLPRNVPADELQATLDALAEAGEVTRAGRPKGDWRCATRGLGLPRGTAARLLEELRAECAGG